MKATFQIVPDGACRLAEKQRPIAPDTPFLDELGRSLAWADDMVANKPHTDFVIHGNFHAPGGVPAGSGRAGFRFGPLAKDLIFHGPRQAMQKPDGTWEVGPAEAVASVPLRWELSYGGLHRPENPMGVGTEPFTLPDGRRVVNLPQIEYPDQPWRGIDAAVMPANFAPVPPSFASRLRKRGTRDRAWAVRRAPLPPKDYDPAFHNAAPDDQQAGDCPHGNEILELLNLHPAQPTLRFTLPGIYLRAGAVRRHGLIGHRAEAVALRLDTVVVLPEEDALVLLWRGQIPLADMLGQDLLWLQIESAPLSDTLNGFDERMLAAYEASVPDDDARMLASVQDDLKEVRERLAKANVPDELRQQIAATDDPQALFDILNEYVQKSLAAIKPPPSEP